MMDKWWIGYLGEDVLASGGFGGGEWASYGWVGAK